MRSAGTRWAPVEEEEERRRRRGGPPRKPRKVWACPVCCTVSHLACIAGASLAHAEAPRTQLIPRHGWCETCGLATRLGKHRPRRHRHGTWFCRRSRIKLAGLLVSCLLLHYIGQTTAWTTATWTATATSTWQLQAV